jgi:hypothetical protein
MKDSKRILIFILGPWPNLAKSSCQFDYITKLRGKKNKVELGCYAFKIDSSSLSKQV